jgi:hypothetical protein
MTDVHLMHFGEEHRHAWRRECRCYPELMVRIVPGTGERTVEIHHKKLRGPS